MDGIHIYIYTYIHIYIYKPAIIYRYIIAGLCLPPKCFVISGHRSCTHKPMHTYVFVYVYMHTCA